MKTNRFARTILKLRVILFGLVVLGVGVLGFELGDSVAERFPTAKSGGPEAQCPPSLGLHTLMASAR